MKKTLDARYKKAEKSIQESFEHLLLTDGFKEMTTTQIIQEAGINRATFYAHYPDKYALLDVYEEAELSNLMQHLKLNLPDLNREADPWDFLQITIEQSVQYLYEHRHIYAALLESPGDESFRKKLRNYIQASWLDRNLTDHFILPAKYTVVVITGVIGSLLELWLKEGCQEPVQKMVSMICRVLAGMLDIPLNT